MDKQQQRQLAYLARNAQVDKDKISATICQRIIELPEYQQAETVLWYVHCRSEVRTLSALNRELQGTSAWLCLIVLSMKMAKNALAYGC
jgi:5-formyltetrahydrofolate cyclo-ligase